MAAGLDSSVSPPSSRSRRSSSAACYISASPDRRTAPRARNVVAMLVWLLPLLIGAGEGDDAKDSKAELFTIVKKVEEAASYTFTCKTLTNEALEQAEDEPPENTKPVRGGARRDVWTVEYVRDRPVHYLKGHADFVRDGNRYVAIGRNDEWQPIELPPPVEGDAAGRSEKVRGIARLAVEIERMPLPHALLAEL